MPALNGIIFRAIVLKGPTLKERDMFVYTSLTMHIWKITPIRTGVEGPIVNLGPV